jgi:hypothetical protein
MRGARKPALERHVATLAVGGPGSPVNSLELRERRGSCPKRSMIA